MGDNEMEQNCPTNVITESNDSSDGETEVELPQIVQPGRNSITNPTFTNNLYENNTPIKLQEIYFFAMINKFYILN